MASTKAQRSQRNRREKEKEKSLFQLARPPKKKKKNQENAPILIIPSNSGNKQASTQIHDIKPSDSDIGLPQAWNG
jgi:hypothetical protein